MEIQVLVVHCDNSVSVETRTVPDETPTIPADGD